MQEGISKGGTLRKVIGLFGSNLSPENVITLGDSPTDRSLFVEFPNSILIPHPNLRPEQRKDLESVAGFVSDHAIDEGFVEVISRILHLREE
jgi:hydroxymethylpyrimidine pyrophosphatase-like HAD family hydrolase